MRSTASLLVIFLQIVSGSGSVVSTMATDPAEIDPCTGSTEIPSADRRVSHTSVSGTRCDSDLTTGWYRFTIGGTPTIIPTSCIRPKACGSELSLRIDLGGAGLPGTGEEIGAWSCGAYDVLGKYDCCVLRQPVRIRNCTSFLAYHLPKPDRCSVSYCVQDIDMPVPHTVLVKTGESVNAVDTPTSPTAETLATTTDTTFPDEFRRCIEGQVYCTRGPTHRCRSIEDCEAIPFSTEAVTSETSTNNYTEVDLTTVSNAELTTATTENSTEISTNVSTSTETVEDTSVVSADTAAPVTEEEYTTTNVPSTTVTRRLFPPITTGPADGTPPPTAEPEPTLLHNDSTTHPLPEETTLSSDNGTTESNTTNGPVAVGETSSVGHVTSTSNDTAGIVPATSEGTTTLSPVGVNVSESYIVSTNASGDSEEDTTAVTGSVVTSDGGDVTSHSLSTISETSPAASVPPSSAAVTSSTTSSVVQTSHSSSSVASTLSTEPSTTTGSSAGTSMPSSTQTTSVTMTTQSTEPTTTILTRRSSTASSVTTGWIVLEFTKTKSEIDYSSKVKSSLPDLLNTVYKQGNQLSHNFSANDINIMNTVLSTATAAVVLKVTYEESGHTVTIDDDDLLQMFRILKRANRLNDEEFVDKMGTTIVDFYKYGDRPFPTVPPKAKHEHFSLFYDKLPLFIAIIVMASICLLICLFGIVYLKFFRHQRTWDTHKDMERARLKDNKVHEGLDNPVPDSEMMKDEQTITETPLTVNGSHPPPSVMADDEKGWVIPIDQAPESPLQVALRTEDTKL